MSKARGLRLAFWSNVIEPIVLVEKNYEAVLLPAAAARCNQATQTESQTSHRHWFGNCFCSHCEVLEVFVVAVTAIVEGDCRASIKQRTESVGELSGSLEVVRFVLG
jgi:hypothetical protein